jgi:phage FluMu protein Com
VTIEFRCDQCGKLLRTADGTEGKKAKCPHCATVLNIPSPGDAPALDATFAWPGQVPPPPPPNSAAGPGFNAYSAPVAGAAPPPVHELGAAGTIQVGDIFGQTWQIFKGSLGQCVLGGIVTSVCMNLCLVIALLLASALVQHDDGLSAVLRFLLNQVVSSVVSAFFTIGLIKYSLSIARGETIQFSDLFSGLPLLVPVAIVTFAFSTGAAISFCFLVVPGIIFMALFCLAPVLAVDQNLGVVDAFRRSAEIAKGNLLSISLIGIVAMLVGGLFALFTCGLGSLILPIAMYLLLSVIYLRLTGQPTVLDRAPSAERERGFAPGSAPA